MYKVVSHILYHAEETTQTFLDFSSCVEPTIFWKKDGKCYTLGERGPCNTGEILIFSRADYAAKCTQSVRTILPGPNISSKTITTSSPRIKTVNSDDNIAFGDESEPIGEILENNETENSDEICNHVDQIFWPEDGNCYSLLDQGPCQDGQWLILNSTKPIRAKCALIPCPVGEQVFWSALCQCIDIDNTIRSGRYSPLEVCGERSRMVLNPYGEGECACEVGFFKDNQGICHALGSQGPCDTGLSWELVSDTVECVDTREGLEVRVFDLIPHDQRRAEVVKCFKDSKGNCRQTLGLNINRIGEDRNRTEFLNERFGEDGNGTESDFETFINNYPVQAKANCAINPCKEDMIPWINGSCYQVYQTKLRLYNPLDQWIMLPGIPN
ncbi:uncharacterized protein LOC111701135 [Eurytemora carolleeae]|uniref:uncharacterized protein LOC111701135 n=1 Tax=Eurytemora carolleeae TaxID=1294199 RepID=UPI000C78D149|nr:uncharacterized protein LOC111701135 [Eurytemora carolleeae]|eukprot:XP_023328067.1 uncharacterized protein LOC111701135 [Eurytemora affinis]